MICVRVYQVGCFDPLPGLHIVGEEGGHAFCGLKAAGWRTVGAEDAREPMCQECMAVAGELQSLIR